jgi:toxin ParE1/3/4
VSHEVRLSQAAISDITIIRQWIATKAGPEVATDYTNRIEKKLETLAHFPNKGTPRPDFSPDCRSTTFERRYLIVYRVMDDFVRVERIVDGYRDWDWLK